MKKTNVAPARFIFLISITSSIIQAQVPQAVNYQAVARTASGAVMPNQSVNLRLSIRDLTSTGAIEYQEIDTTTTNQFGLFSIAIGTGSVVQGSFSSIDWGNGDKYLQVEMTPSSGSNYVAMGNSQLISVPYALYAKTASNSWTNYASYDERVPSGYPPYTILTDSAWSVRSLNITEMQVGNAISKTGNDISLQPGIYHITATAPWGWDIPYNSNLQSGFPSARTMLRVMNTTNNTVLLLSPSQTVMETRGTLNGSILHETYSLQLEGEITITTTSTIELQHLIKSISYGSGPVNYDAGIAASLGQDEIYATIHIQKIN